MKNKVTKFALASYTHDHLDAEIVDTIATKLTRRELKHYIRLLKHMESKKEIMVTIPKELNKQEQDMIKQLFPEKRVNYMIDAEMVSGIKIIDSDMEYELSLNKTFHDIITYLQYND